MGPYCKFCNQRCFCHFPPNTPAEVQQAYGTSTIIATCAAGQAFEMQQVGWNYDRIMQAIEIMLPIGTPVRIRSTQPDSTHRACDVLAEAYRGKIGTFIKISQHSNDGDFYGVQFPDDTLCTIYFWREELENVYTLTTALNNEDGATATAQNVYGVTVEVTYHASPNTGHPFWLWMEAGLSVVKEEDVHRSFDHGEMSERIASMYDLDSEAAIWARKEPEPMVTSGEGP